ncbi:hypothetical protein KM043_014796 [Ampulex compressa]|nr:hypothetical protein KM043_014796 [Ampulex compressa]
MYLAKSHGNPRVSALQIPRGCTPEWRKSRGKRWPVRNSRQHLLARRLDDFMAIRNDAHKGQPRGGAAREARAKNGYGLAGRYVTAPIYDMDLETSMRRTGRRGIAHQEAFVRRGLTRVRGSREEGRDPEYSCALTLFGGFSFSTQCEE